MRQLYGNKMWDTFRRNSKGWTSDCTAKVHTRIEFGPHFKIPEHTTHVINCAEDTFAPRWFKETYPDNYVCLNAIDSEESNIIEWYPAFEKAMNTFLKDPDCKLVYVHCQCGINRSAFLVLTYMCKKFGYDVEYLVKSITTQRPCAFSNKAFRKQVIEFIKKHQ